MANRALTYAEYLYEKVDAFPERTALIEHPSGRRITFSELRRQVTAVASALVKRSFGKGQFLTLYASNCLEYVPIAHGTIATTGTLHLMKPNVSRDELLVYMRLVQPRFLVVTADKARDASSVAQESDSGVDAVFVIGEAPDGCRSAQELLEDDGSENPMGKVEVDVDRDVAVMLMTGGTTGLSKMVMASHTALKIEDEPFSYARFASDVLVAFAPFSYITSFLVGFRCSIRQGGTVVCMARFTPDSLIEVIDEYRVTGLILSPAISTLMIRSLKFQDCSLTSVRWVMAGGAPIPPDTEKFIVEKLQEKVPELQFIQVFACTEGLTVLTEALPEKKEELHKEGTVGLPRQNVEVKVVNVRDDSVDCKHGESGQVLFKSPYLMNGYFKNEELTKKVLKNGWYLTGDYGWLDEDNYLYVVDRINELIINDTSVVVPCELEALIQTHPKVKECVVIAKKLEGGCFPKAYVVVNEQVSADEIKQFVADRVDSSHHLLRGVTFIDKIPKSLAGKLLRSALAET